MDKIIYVAIFKGTYKILKHTKHTGIHNSYIYGEVALMQLHAYTYKQKMSTLTLHCLWGDQRQGRGPASKIHMKRIHTSNP